MLIHYYFLYGFSDRCQCKRNTFYVILGAEAPNLLFLFTKINTKRAVLQIFRTYDRRNATRPFSHVCPILPSTDVCREVCSNNLILYTRLRYACAPGKCVGEKVQKVLLILLSYDDDDDDDYYYYRIVRTGTIGDLSVCYYCTRCLRKYIPFQVCDEKRSRIIRCDNTSRILGCGGRVSTVSSCIYTYV